MRDLTSDDGIRCPGCRDTPTFGELRQVVIEGGKVRLPQYRRRSGFVGRCPACNEPLYLDRVKFVEVG